MLPSNRVGGSGQRPVPARISDSLNAGHQINLFCALQRVGRDNDQARRTAGPRSTRTSRGRSRPAVNGRRARFPATYPRLHFQPPAQGGVTPGRSGGGHPAVPVMVALDQEMEMASLHDPGLARLPHPGQPFLRVRRGSRTYQHRRSGRQQDEGPLRAMRVASPARYRPGSRPNCRDTGGRPSQHHPQAKPVSPALR